MCFFWLNVVTKYIDVFQNDLDFFLVRWMKLTADRQADLRILPQSPQKCNSFTVAPKYAYKSLVQIGRSWIIVNVPLPNNHIYALFGCRKLGFWSNLSKLCETVLRKWRKCWLFHRQIWFIKATSENKYIISEWFRRCAEKRAIRTMASNYH